MPTSSLTHGVFKVERIYEASVERVYHIFTDAQARQNWYIGKGGWVTHKYTPPKNVIPGAREFSSFSPPRSGTTFNNLTYYLEVVPNTLLIYTYTMSIDDTPVSTSLVTVEFIPSRKGTKIVTTVQGAYRDNKVSSRKRGTIALLESLAREVHRQVTQK